MRAGKLRHRITIQQRSESARDDYGAPTYAWSTLATRWASIEPLRGQERFIADQTQSGVTHRVRLRYLSGVKPEMRFDYDGRTFEIAQVLNRDELGAELELLCFEVTD